MAPSVKVRRRAYTTIAEPPSRNYEEPRPLASIFLPPNENNSTPEACNTLQLQRSPTTVGPVSVSPTHMRPRLTSKVHHHCMRQSKSMGFPRAPVPSDWRSRTSHAESGRTMSPTHLVPRDGKVTMEGSQTDVQVRSDGEPGLIGSALSLQQSQNLGTSNTEEDEHHHDDIVEHLDVIDPQVATVANLTNAANSILIPPLSWYSRKPVVVLSSMDLVDEEQGDRQYEDSLDRHVDDILKRPSKFKRTMRGVWSFLKTPMGIIAGIYGFLVVFWGAAIVIFLAKIINFHNANTQGFWVEVSSQVENGLFTVTGIGLIPSRVLDTYRIYKIWYYKRRTRKLRKKAGLPQLFDVDDLPDPAFDPNYVHVLTEKEQKDLHRQQCKFQHHQTWYRAHGTETHRAFPINTALLICCLNDGNSIFQIILCGTMWGLNRFQRPAWSTGILIPASFLCGILSGIFIWKGGQKTKRIDKVKERLRAALAMEYPYGYGTDMEDETAMVGGGGSGKTSAADPEKVIGEAMVDEHMTVPPAGEKETLGNAVN